MLRRGKGRNVDTAQPEGTVLPLAQADDDGPWRTFRVAFDTNKYPSKHPVLEIYLFMSRDGQGLTLSTPLCRRTGTGYGKEAMVNYDVGGLSEGQWLQAQDKDGSRVPPRHQG